jgi:uncharacterized membrane protein
MLRNEGAAFQHPALDGDPVERNMAGIRVTEERARMIGIASFLFAILQAICPAVIAFSGLRVLIGLSSLAVVAGTNAPAHGFHADRIRIPMMTLALIGTLLNLFVIWQVRRLRKRPAAQWRIQPVSPKTVRSERLQIALAVLTFAGLISEWITHPMIHHPH